MNKLMVAVAVIAMAVGAKAASFEWSASDVKDVLGENLYSGAITMYYAEKITGSDPVFSEYMTGSMSAGAFVIDEDPAHDLTGGKTYYFYYTMDDGKGNLFTSAQKSGKANTSAQTRYVDFADGGAWASVPEPTSGLLLLLGVAGLALRRRRA